jgi:hypothetical protein
MTIKQVIITATALTCLAGSAAWADQSSDKMKNDLKMNEGASSGASNGEQGKTSDRTPGNPSPDRTIGANNSGAAGVDAAKSDGHTSDRTPNKNEQ